ncbi:MAG: hypothetical protein JO142_21320 [Burkholderiales bacterium]|nr:hypothetical protein [Burkholderiales bacterium]
MTKARLPAKSSRAYVLLQALLEKPGTFYQVCERAGFDLDDPKIDESMRRMFGHLIGGNVRLDGIIYSLTDEARTVLTGYKPEPYVGQVAGAAHRGTPYIAPVRIVRREGARA